MSSFEALEVSIEAVCHLRVIVTRVRPRSARLARQIEDAASSVALNLAEGAQRRGQDRVHLFRVAAGSAAEVRAGLRIAEAWGYVTPEATAPSEELVDRVLAMLWRLTHHSGGASG